MWGRFNYREIVASQRIVWLNSFSNEKCGITRAPFSELCPLEIENSVMFTEHAGTTTVALRAEPFGESAENAISSTTCSRRLNRVMAGLLDQLAGYLIQVR